MIRNRSDLYVGIAFYALLMLAAILYWPGLSGDLILDDHPNLESFEHLLSGLISWDEAILGSTGGPSGRPVTMLTLVINYLLTGDDVWHLKFTNFGLHLICASLLLWLGGRIVMISRPDSAAANWWWALWMTMLWLFAPLFVSTVLYVIQRATILATLFTLLGLLLYVCGRQHLDDDPRAARVMLVLAFAGCWPLAILSKESGALLPLLAWVVEALVFKFRAGADGLCLLRKVFLAVLWMPVAALLIAFVLSPDWFLQGYQHREFQLHERLWSEARIFLDYCQQLLLPQGGRMGVFHDDYPRSTGLMQPPATLASVVALGLLAWGSWRLRHRWPLLQFGFWFFVAGHLMESTVLPLELYFEHRNYLPAFGLYVGVLAVVADAWQRPELRRYMTVLVVLLPVLYYLSSYQRVQVWQSWPMILYNAELAHPESPRVHADLAALFMEAGDHAGAMYHIEKIGNISPHKKSGVALYQLLASCGEDSSVATAAGQTLQDVRVLDTDYFTIRALVALFKSYDEGKCTNVPATMIMPHVHRWLLNSPLHQGRNAMWNVRFALGKLFATAAMPVAAMVQYQMAMELYPERLEAGINLLHILTNRGDLRAVDTLVRNLRRNDTGRYRYHSEALAKYRRFVNQARDRGLSSLKPFGSQ